MEIIKIHNSKVDFLEYFLVMIIIIFPISILFYKKIEIRNRKWKTVWDWEKDRDRKKIWEE